MHARFETHRRLETENDDVQIIFLNLFRDFCRIMKNLVDSIRAIVDSHPVRLCNAIDILLGELASACYRCPDDDDDEKIGTCPQWLSREKKVTTTLSNNFKFLSYLLLFSPLVRKIPS